MLNNSNFSAFISILNTNLLNLYSLPHILNHPEVWNVNGHESTLACCKLCFMCELFVPIQEAGSSMEPKHPKTDGKRKTRLPSDTYGMDMCCRAISAFSGVLRWVPSCTVL